MANLIIGIHGLSNKPPKSTLSDWWKAAIKEGLDQNCGIEDADFEFEMVYWADLLYKNPQHTDKNFDFDSLYTDQPYIPAVQGNLKEYKEGWLDNIREAVSNTGGRVLDAAREYTGLGAVSDWLLDQKLRDLAFYYDKTRLILDRNERAREARQVLMDELMNTLKRRRGDRMMLIAHSMGTIISYDVLRELGQQSVSFPVQHFVTIGSPLGLPIVKERIYSERSYTDVPVRTPTVVTERWVNYADRKDVVAIDTHLRDDFRENDSGIRVEDDLVLNSYVGLNGDVNSHKSYGYLRTPELSSHIRSFLEL